MEVPVHLAIDTTEAWEKSDTVLGESELAIELAGPRGNEASIKYLLVGDGKPVGPGSVRLRATPELIAGLPETLKGLELSTGMEAARAIKEEQRIEGKFDKALNDETKRAVKEEQRIEGKFDKALDDETKRAAKEEQRLDERINEEKRERSIALGKETTERRTADEDEAVQRERGDKKEYERATGEEQRIEEKTDTETRRAEDSEKALNNVLAAEMQRAEGRETYLEGAIAAEAQRAQKAESTLDGNKINRSAAGEEKTLVQAIEIKEITSNSFVAVYKNRNVESAEVTETKLELPQASEQKSGIMPAESFVQIDENTRRIAALEGRALHYTVTLASDSPSQEELQTAFEEASGTEGAAPDQVTLDDLAFKKSYTWYARELTWVDRGNTSIAPFSNSSPGLIQGDNVDGKVFAEENGTGSVVGWTGLKNRVANNENELGAAGIALSNLEEEVNRKEGTIPSGGLPVAKGGTGAATAAGARENLGAAANTPATAVANGLLSATDKNKLDGIAPGAQVNPGNATQSVSGLLSAADKKKLDELIINSLTSTSTGQALSANQGKILKELTDNISGWLYAVETQVKKVSSDYSTEEKDTGIKWLYGQPVYRKTFSIMSPAIPANTRVTIGSTAQFIPGAAFITDSAVVVENQGVKGKYNDFSIILEGANVQIFRPNGFSAGSHLIITVEYIK